MRAKITKQAMAAAAGLAFVLALAAVPVLAKEKYEEKFAKTESLERDGKVVIVNVSGKIEIRSWDQAQVKIEAVKVSQASTLDKAKEDAAKVTIEVAKTGNILTIETKYPESRMFRGNNINVSVDYILMVPDKAGVKARNVSGSVLAEGIGGPLEVDVVSGTVTVSKAAQGLDLRTVSGTITVADAAGDADLKTVSGTIKAERIKGSISAETTSGAVRLTEVSGAKSIRAKVLSGNITYGGEIQAGGRYGFEALSGTIEVELPASASFDLDAETFSGHIQTDFPVTMSGRISPKEIRGVVGSGGSTLRVKSFSGSIRIVKK